MSPCSHCGAMPAEFLCDYALGWWMTKTANWAGKEERVVKDVDKSPPTCDAPICGKCKTSSEPIFWCGEDGHVEWMDFCPEHSKDGCVLTVGPGRYETAEEIEAERKRIVVANRAAYRVPLEAVPHDTR